MRELVYGNAWDDGPDVAELRSVTRRFVGDFVEQRAQELDEREEFPADLYAQMARLNMFGITVPASLGGLGASARAFSVVMEELAAGYASIADQVVLVEVVSTLLAQYGSETQWEEYLRPTLQAEKWCSYALTEPDAGSDLAAIRTKAERVDGGWVLDGEKVFIQNAPVADFAVVLAVTNRADARHGMSAFVVNLRGTKGVTVSRREHKMGQRASQLGSVVMDHAEIPGDSLLGEEGLGLQYMRAVLAKGRLGIAALALGISRAALRVATSRANSRAQFGEPIIRKQAIGFAIADMFAEYRVGRLLVDDAARHVDTQSPDATVACSVAKLVTSENCVRHSSAAIQVCGGSGYLKGNEAERLYRDARVTTIYEGTSEVQRLILSRAIAREEGEW